MIFKKSNSPLEGARFLSESLNSALKRSQNTAWFVSGGSNIQIAVAIQKSLTSIPEGKLRILLVDERFGPVNHSNSNYFQLKQAGFDITYLAPVLDESMSADEAVTYYDNYIKDTIQWADVTIGQFGIGADGHTAGILPQSPLALDITGNYFAGYQASDYFRLSITLAGIRVLSAAIVYAYGEAKKDQIMKLHDRNLPVSTQPAQVFKQHKEAYIINDVIGETN